MRRRIRPTFAFALTPGTDRQPAEAQNDCDNEHQHKDLICGHTPSFSISFH
jgi:hypothetical protein